MIAILKSLTFDDLRHLFASVSLVILSLSIAQNQLWAQNTVGLIDLERGSFSDGYGLFYPHNQSSVYLINTCGELVHRWDDEPDMRPGNMAYLMEDGRLVRLKRPNNPTFDSIWAGGGGAYIDIVEWDGTVSYQFFQNDERARLHHDATILPNGNILAISWEYKSRNEAIQAGRNPDLLAQNRLWPDYILELDPVKDSIVWEWHVWDHLIQDYDAEKENFGEVGVHPELVDINWQTNDGNPDWMHSNALDYNKELDQIMLCVPAFNEIWIIDHSTTTEESKGQTGGRSGKGGDLLFRWGNPQTYRAAGEQKLFWPHDAHWVDQFLSEDHPQYGKIAVFNNRVGPDYSSVHLFSPVMDDMTGDYLSSIEGAYLPDDFELTVLHPDTFPMYSTGLSSVQVLENENLLVCSGRTGHIFEIDPGQNSVVWEYRVPLKGGSPVAQGDTLVLNNNLTFRFTQYPLDYDGFNGQDLSPKGYIELDPDESFCDLLTPTDDPSLSDVLVYPNPVTNQLNITFSDTDKHGVRLINLDGRMVFSDQLSGSDQININHLERGLYVLIVDGKYMEKIIVR